MIAGQVNCGDAELGKLLEFGSGVATCVVRKRYCQRQWIHLLTSSLELNEIVLHRACRLWAEVRARIPRQFANMGLAFAKMHQ